jgi:uncharacterized membrane protein AbrB (regulator of aidB expression)
MSDKIIHKNQIQLLRILFAIFAVALVISFFHYHKNFEINEKSCAICSFLTMLMAAAVTWFVFLIISPACPLATFEAVIKTIPIFLPFCALRAPPENEYIDPVLVF